MRLTTLLFILVVFLAIFCLEETFGKRRGGGRNSGRSSGRTWIGSRSRSYGKTGGTKFSTIKKVAAVGAVAYGAYKIGELSTKFSSFNWGNTYHPKYSFDSWNRWRQDDGLLCRNDYDCWISSDMVCYPETFSLKINVSL